MILAAVLSILLFLVPTQSDAAQILDLAAYRQAIQSSLTSLQVDPNTSNAVAENLRAIVAVRMPDQSTIEPNLSTVVYYLESAPPRVADAETSLSAILDQIDRAQRAGLSAEQTSTADANLRTILARAEFQQKPTRSNPSILGWVIRQLGRVLGPILGPAIRFLAGLFSKLLPSPSVFMIGAIIVGLVTIVAVIVGPIRGIRRGFGPATAHFPVSVDGTRMSAMELRQEAESLARENSYRMAIRTLYLAALIRLDERGVLVFERSLTNREVLRTALTRGGAGLAERLAPLVDLFDQHWYGAGSCTETDYREFARLATWAWEAA